MFTPPWKRNRLQAWQQVLVSVGGLVGGAAVLYAKWLYIHPANPAGGTVLSIMADFVPMAIATVGIIMSYRTPKKEHHPRTTLILVVCGFIGTGILSLARIRSEATHKEEEYSHKSEIDNLNQKLQVVGDQSRTILTRMTRVDAATPSPPARIHPATEIDRRRNILTLLRSEYILAHDVVSASLLSGAEDPPADWLNERLKQLGQKWRIGTKVPEPTNRELKTKAQMIALTARRYYTAFLDEEGPLLGNYMSGVRRAKDPDEASGIIRDYGNRRAELSKQEIKMFNKLRDDALTVRAEILPRLPAQTKENLPEPPGAFTDLSSFTAVGQYVSQIADKLPDR